MQDQTLIQDCIKLYQHYYAEAIADLAQKYPRDKRSLRVDYNDIYQYDPDLADDYLQQPEQITEYLEEALRNYELPVDTSLSMAHVRVCNLPESHVHYPNDFSPTDKVNTYQTIRGDVLVSTETYARITNAAFECQRCGTLTRIPQRDDGEFQEPHECKSCERQGPFQINYNQSEFVDGETIQLQTPPEQSNGTGRTLQVFVEDDLCGRVQMGDRVAISGTVKLNQKTNGRQQTQEFIPYIAGQDIQIEEATQIEVDVDPDTKERIKELATGEDGNPLQLAAESLHPKVHGYDLQKKALILAMVGGATQTQGIRGEFHVLFLGDPSTAKSELVNKVTDVAPRSLAVSAKNASSAGLTSTATQGEFSDGRWTLSPGAFVKANEGVVAIDELDDMQKEDRKAMLEPMANQQISVSKAGINATLSTQTTVIAAANPEHSHFDQYEPLAEQFGFESNLLSRFDLIFTFQDRPDPDEDTEIADHVTQYRDAKIREQTAHELEDSHANVVAKPVADDILTKWILLAKQQPDPVYASDSVREQLRDAFVTLRGANGYDSNDEVPVTFRKLPGVERIARAYAKLEFSDTVTEKHANFAMEMVGQSMQDYQTNADGKLDSAITETGKSKSQHELKEDLVDALNRLEREKEEGVLHREDVIKELDGYDKDRLHQQMDKMIDQGEAIRKGGEGTIRHIGRY